MSSKVESDIKGLVSLDGNTDIISTQLRLLPFSPKILILPPLSNAIQQPEEDDIFNPRSFIWQIHEALSSRLQLARTFLQSSSSTQPRLVFMNGGCVSALTICITTIRKKVTNGDIQEAQELFQALVKDGVAGLTSEPGTTDGHKGKDVLSAKAGNGEIALKAQDTGTTHTTERIPSVVMEATGSIDRLIAALQSPLPIEVGDMDIPISLEHTRSTNSPVPPDVLRLRSKFWTDEQVIPEKVTNSAEHARRTTTPVPPDVSRLRSKLWTNERVIPEISRECKSAPESKRGAPEFLPNLRCTSRSSSTCTDALSRQERTDFDGDNLSAQLDRPASAPAIPVSAKQGETSHVHIGGFIIPELVERPKSLDCIRSTDTNPSYLDFGPRMLKLAEFTPFTFDPFMGSESTSDSESDSSEGSKSSTSLESFPRTTYVRALETLPKTSPLQGTVPTNALRAFVNRGTYTGDLESLKSTSADIKEPAPFEPVFRVVEDLIINLNDGINNEVFESVIQSYKNGSFPVRASRHDNPQISMIPTSPTGSISSNDTSTSELSHTSPGTEYDWRHRIQESRPNRINFEPLEDLLEASSDSSSETSTDSPSVYPEDDPTIGPSEGSFDTPSDAPPDGPSDRSSMWAKRVSAGKVVQITSTPKLHIAIASPPPLRSHVAQKFQDFPISSANNAVALQDSLRGLLKIHFPPEATQYRQQIFTVENDRFWKPVFRKDASTRSENRTVDQIIALGYEQGVEKALYNEISEKLGRFWKRSTGGKTNKLDIRYLVIYAMQTFTSQPLSIQAGENPFSQPSLLATLLIPHLETYLSSNDSTSLLILHYPASHLSTVLALRDLLGPQLLKVAGIIDATAITPPKPSQERPNSIASVDEWVSTSTSQSPSLTPETRPTRSTMMPQPSFSKADFVLLSPATDTEISTFLSSIKESLTFPNTSYAPEDALSPTSTIHSDLDPDPSSPSSSNAPTTPLPHDHIPSLRPQKVLSPTRAPKRVSFADSTTSTDLSMENGSKRKGRLLSENMWEKLESDRRGRLTETAWEKLQTERRERLSEKAWEGFSMPGDDEEWEMLERIFMPRIFLAQSVQRVGSSAKALKWLGLD